MSEVVCFSLEMDVRARMRPCVRMGVCVVVENENIYNGWCGSVLTEMANRSLDLSPIAVLETNSIGRVQISENQSFVHKNIRES